MDSQHRHELEQNELADWLAKGIEAAKPHMTALVGGAIAVILAVFGWSWLQQANALNEEASWSLFSRAVLSRQPNMNDLEQASTFNDSKVADWSSATWADGQLAMATQLYLRERETADEALQKAKVAYEALIAKRGVNARLKDRARFGLARTAEMEGDIDRAVSRYKEVGGAFREVALARAESIVAPRAAEDFTWLQRAQSPTSRAPLGGRTPGVRPDESPDPLELPGEETTDTETIDDILEGYPSLTTDETELEESTDEPVEEAANQGNSLEEPSVGADVAAPSGDSSSTEPESTSSESAAPSTEPLEVDQDQEE